MKKIVADFLSRPLKGNNIYRVPQGNDEPVGSTDIKEIFELKSFFQTYF